MSDQPAAIRGTFADFRLIKGRKVAQLVVELPIEEADAALATLGGLPQPATERWVAVARLNGSAKPEAAKEKRRWDDLKAAMQAGIRCNEPAFWQFVQEEYNAPARDEESAAKFVRRYCGVKSRSEINLSPNSSEAWRRLESKYKAWLGVPE
jgi:hypothetical protein